METAKYEVDLYLADEYIGNVRQLAVGLKWTRKRTQAGVDSISFSINDVTFAAWLDGRTQRTIDQVLRPYALECQIKRNGEAMVSGYLATKPGYSPNGTSATLTLQFDGYLNYLAGIYEPPTPTRTGKLSDILVGYITEAEARATKAGKPFGIKAGKIDTLATITQTFDSYKSLKEFITDRCDNTSGAGKFDVYFHDDKTYDIIADKNFGRVREYTIQYPARPSGVSALSISAGEVSGFASKVIVVGEGSTNADEQDATAITSEATNSQAVNGYAYVEQLVQLSSISDQQTLDTRAQSELAELAAPNWEPQLSLSGVQIAPGQGNGVKIWIGDTVTIKNDEDMLGATNGKFRVMELEVAVSATDSETITPKLERIVDNG